MKVHSIRCEILGLFMLPMDCGCPDTDTESTEERKRRRLYDYEMAYGRAVAMCSLEPKAPFNHPPTFPVPSD